MQGSLSPNKVRLAQFDLARQLNGKHAMIIIPPKDHLAQIGFLSPMNRKPAMSRMSSSADCRDLNSMDRFSTPKQARKAVWDAVP